MSGQCEQQKGRNPMVGTTTSLCLLALCHRGTHLLPWAKGETGNLNPAFIPANVIFRSFLRGLSHCKALSDSWKQSEGRPKEMRAARPGYSCDWELDNGWGGRGKCCCPRSQVISWKSFAKARPAGVESTLSSGFSAVSEPSCTMGSFTLNSSGCLLHSDLFFWLGKRDEQNTLWFSERKALWRQWRHSLKILGGDKSSAACQGKLDTERFLPGVVSPQPGSSQGQRPILNLPVWQRQSGDGDFPALSPKAGSNEVQRAFDSLTNVFQHHPSALLGWTPLSSAQSGSVLSLWHPETGLATNQSKGLYSLKKNKNRSFKPAE